MTTQVYPNAIQNIHPIQKGESQYFDVGITVGERPEEKLIHAEKHVLSRTSYFTNLFSTQDSESGILSISLPDISPKIFEIIYEYLRIQKLELDLDELKTPDIIEFLIAANKFGIKNVVDYLQDFLIERKSYWMEHNFIYIYRISFDCNFNMLQNFCNHFINNSPELIFHSPDFNTIPEGMLISLIKRDDLLLEEVVIWKHVLEWGLARHPNLTEDPKTWSQEDIKNVEKTLKECLPLVRFSQLTPAQFYERAHPYINRFDPDLHDKLLKYYLVPETPNLYIPRIAETNSSKIIENHRILSPIFSHITKIINNDIIYDYSSRYSSSYNSSPYELKLLLRGSRHGFTPKIFHELCDNKPSTITIIKVKGKDEILGGYNPGEWKSKNGYGCCKSFIFSLSNNSEKTNISHVDYMERALNYGINYGPSFGLSDLIVSGQNFKYGGRCYCKMDDYREHIRYTENIFSIEDYEVFQVTKK